MMIEDLVVRLRQHEADEQTMEPCYNGLRDEAAFTLERMVRVLALVYGHLWHEETTHARRAIKQCLSVEQCRRGINESREIYGTQDGERMDGRLEPLDLPRPISMALKALKDGENFACAADDEGSGSIAFAVARANLLRWAIAQTTETKQ